MDKKRQKSGEADTKSGEVMAKAEKRKLPKTHKDYWKEKVVKLPYKDRRTGKEEESKTYSVRLAHLKKRAYFNLNTANRMQAGDKAREIYNFLKANGWEPTLAKYKQKAEEAAEIETVGDLISVASERADIRAMTFRQYVGALRRIIGAINGYSSSDPSKFRPGGSKWQLKVDKVKLSSITEAQVQVWRKKQLEKLSPREMKNKEVSINSTLNKARSIWKHSGLPSPFEGLKWKQTVKRFEPSIDAPSLLYYAQEELKGERLEEFKAFALCLYLGLRKREADCLTWEQIDFVEGKVRVETTEFFKPKSENSEREVSIQKTLLPTISKWRKGADKTFVLKGGEAKPLSEFTYYRANETWKALTAWLQSKGVNNPKPIHYLRKLSGSLMYSANDVYAAQRFLGHSDIRTTIGSYVHVGNKTFPVEPIKPEPKAI